MGHDAFALAAERYADRRRDIFHVTRVGQLAGFLVDRENAQSVRISSRGQEKTARWVDVEISRPGTTYWLDLNSLQSPFRIDAKHGDRIMSAIAEIDKSPGGMDSDFRTAGMSFS